MTPTQTNLSLLTDAWTRWHISNRDYPALANPEPKASDYGVTEWAGESVRKQVEREFKRMI